MKGWSSSAKHGNALKVWKLELNRGPKPALILPCYHLLSQPTNVQTWALVGTPPSSPPCTDGQITSTARCMISQFPLHSVKTGQQTQTRMTALQAPLVERSRTAVCPNAAPSGLPLSLGMTRVSRLDSSSGPVINQVHGTSGPQSVVTYLAEELWILSTPLLGLDISPTLVHSESQVYCRSAGLWQSTHDADGTTHSSPTGGAKARREHRDACFSFSLSSCH